jgi:hypothetical protein
MYGHSTQIKRSKVGLGTPVTGVLVQGEVNPAKAMMFQY